MKLLGSTYIHLTLEPGRSSWSFTLPTQLLSVQNPQQHLRLSLKKLVLRNDFPVLRPGRDSITVNGNTYVLPTGSPTGLLLARKLTALLNTTHGLLVSFDGWDGSLTITNAGASTATLTPLGNLPQALGLPSTPIVIAPGETYQGAPVNLAPPETLILRSPQLTGSSLEIRSGDTGVVSASILAVIGLDTVPYGTKVYLDSEALYSHILTDKMVGKFEMSIEDEFNQPVTSNNPMVAVLVVDTLSDDQGAHLEVSKEQAETMKLMLLQGDLLRAPPQGT